VEIRKGKRCLHGPRSSDTRRGGKCFTYYTSYLTDENEKRSSDFKLKAIWLKLSRLGTIFESRGIGVTDLGVEKIAVFNYDHRTGGH